MLTFHVVFCIWLAHQLTPVDMHLKALSACCIAIAEKCTTVAAVELRQVIAFCSVVIVSAVPTVFTAMPKADVFVILGYIAVVHGALTAACSALGLSDSPHLGWIRSSNHTWWLGVSRIRNCLATALPTFRTGGYHFNRVIIRLSLLVAGSSRHL